MGRPELVYPLDKQLYLEQFNREIKKTGIRFARVDGLEGTLANGLHTLWFKLDVKYDRQKKPYVAAVIFDANNSVMPHFSPLMKILNKYISRR